MSPAPLGLLTLGGLSLGWLRMSKRDIKRIEVLADVVAGRITSDSASLLLDMSVRQVQRLLNRYKDGGGAALIHRARGKRSFRGMSIFSRVEDRFSLKRIP
jgi:hypothetical protein